MLTPAVSSQQLQKAPLTFPRVPAFQHGCSHPACPTPQAPPNARPSQPLQRDAKATLLTASHPHLPWSSWGAGGAKHTLSSPLPRGTQNMLLQGPLLLVSGTSTIWLITQTTPQTHLSLVPPALTHLCMMKFLCRYWRPRSTCRTMHLTCARGKGRHQLGELGPATTWLAVGLPPSPT